MEHLTLSQIDAVSNILFIALLFTLRHFIHCDDNINRGKDGRYISYKLNK